MQTSISSAENFSETPTLTGKYRLQTPVLKKCQAPVRGIGSHCRVRHVKKDTVDVESTLRGLDHKLDNYRSPVKDIDASIITPVQMTDTILKTFEPMITREKKPCNRLSEMDYKRQDPFLPKGSNPQTLNRVVITEQDRGGLQTRWNAKDEYETKCLSKFATFY